MSKNFSCNNTGKRRKADFYETPYSITQQLLDVESFRGGSILEPACGDGAIVKVLERNGYKATAYDAETDFLKETRKFDYVITNPPYSLAYDFILRCSEVVKQKCALLLPLSYLHGKQRHDEIYKGSLPLKLRNVYVFTRYPMLGEPLREDGKYPTGMMVYAWYIFENGYSGNPYIDWLDNNQFVARAD